MGLVRVAVRSECVTGPITHSVTLALVAATSSVGIAACGSNEPPPACPSTWTYDEEARVECLPSDDYVAALEASIGSGAYGFAISTTGDCMPTLTCQMHLGQGECESVLATGVEVVAYAAVDVTGTITPSCYADYELSPGAQPAGSAVTDDEGVYVIPLAEGSYALTATDPLDQCLFLAGHADVTADARLGRVLFDFNHGSD